MIEEAQANNQRDFQISDQSAHRFTCSSDLKRSEIQQALNDIAADPKSQSESIIRKCLTYVRAIFNFAIDDELLERSPVPPKKISLPRMRPPSERILTFEEAQRLLAIAGQRDNLN